MKKSLTIISLLGLLCSMNLSAQNPAADKPAMEEGKKHHHMFWHMLKKHKMRMLETALKNNNVDEATSKKVMDAVKEMIHEKKKNFKELKMKLKQELMDRMMKAGLSEDTAKKVMADYKAQKKEMKHKVIERLKGMMEEMKAKK